MRFLPRTRAHLYKGGGHFLRYCEILRAHLFRNAINIGLPIFECPDAVGQIREGDAAEVNLSTGEILGPRLKKTIQIRTLSTGNAGDYPGRRAYEFCKEEDGRGIEVATCSGKARLATTQLKAAEGLI